MMTTITMNPKTNVYAISLTTGETETIVADGLELAEQGVLLYNTDKYTGKIKVVDYFKEDEYTRFKLIRSNLER